jgi:hypothetical protein
MMKKKLVISLFLLLMCVLCALQSQAASIPGQEGVNWSGYLLIDLPLMLGKELQAHEIALGCQELRLDLTLEAALYRDSRFYGDIWLQGWSPPQINDASELGSLANISPMELDLREAYLDLYAIMLPGLDLRLGRQRIAWARAESISIIDNLNPDDLQNPWDYGRHLASDAVKFTFYWNAAIIEGVYIPFFKPARLPESEISALSSPGTTLILPGNEPLKNAVLAARLSAFAGGWDLSLSYIFGRDDLLLLTTTILTGDPFNPDIDLTFEYARLHIFGADLAGEIFGWGIWGEAAFFLPQDVTLVTDSTAVGGSRVEEKMSPYFKALLGIDYTLKNGIYINLQYIRGFFNENNKDDLHDYLLTAVEWRILNDAVTIGPLALALEAADLHRLEESWAVVFNPQFTLYPVDGAEITLGLRWIEGRIGTSFAKQREENSIYFKAKYSF